MNDAVFTAYEALEARMKMVDIIANNLANAQTTGFKRDFGQILEEATGTATKIEVYSFVATSRIPVAANAPVREREFGCRRPH